MHSCGLCPSLQRCCCTWVNGRTSSTALSCAAAARKATTSAQNARRCFSACRAAEWYSCHLSCQACFICQPSGQRRATASRHRSGPRWTSPPSLRCVALLANSTARRATLSPAALTGLWRLGWQCHPAGSRWARPTRSHDRAQDGQYGPAHAGLQPECAAAEQPTHACSHAQRRHGGSLRFVLTRRSVRFEHHNAQPDAP